MEMVTPDLQGGVFQNLPVESVRLDVTNPRIRRFLEIHEETFKGEPKAEQIFLALGAGADDDENSGPSFEKLRNSIITNGGIIQPIIVNRRADGTLVCIEGNTRLALYKNFPNEKVKGDWTHIPALVYEDMDESKVDSIRLQIHLVGTRQWDPYSKAKYLHQLRTQELMPFSEIVDYCGGRKKEVVELINAYSDMEQYYRPVIEDDGDFDVKRFSGFVELQKTGVKNAIVEAGFDLTDFAHWVYDGKLHPLNTVRALPRILKHPHAKEVFLKDGAKAAIRLVEQPDSSGALKDASLEQLANALIQKIYNLPYRDGKKIHDDPSCEAAQLLNELLVNVSEFMNSSAAVS